jgi:hypothetical protein
MADATTDAMLEAFQRERNEWHSAAIREILGEYETWRQSSSQVPAEDEERARMLERWEYIQSVERNVAAYSGNEKAGYAEIARLKSKFADEVAAYLTALQVTEGDKS